MTPQAPSPPSMHRLDCTDVGLSAFANAPGSTYYYTSVNHRNLLEGLLKGLRDRLGLHLVLGDFGTGKTTLCNYVLMAYGHEFDMAYLGNPFLSEAEFFSHIASQLGAEVPAEATAKQAVDALEAHLRDRHLAGRTMVVFLDEAHLLDRDLFDRLLVLSNLQEAGVPLLQIVLVGVPQLLGILSGPRFSSLNQRIGSRHVLSPLGRQETAQYVRQRLLKAGCADPGLFEDNALTLIHELSGGRPRLINLLCRLALESLAASGQVTVSPALVQVVSRDPSFATLFESGEVESKPGRLRSRAMLGASLLALVLLAVLVSGDLEGPPPEPEPAAPWQNTVPPAPVPQAFPEPEPLPTVSPPEPAVEAIPEPEPEIAGPLPGPWPEPLPEPLPKQLQAPTPEVPAEDVFAPQEPVEAQTPRDISQARIHAIAWSDNPEQRMALVGDAVLRLGDVFRGATVVDIGPDHVIFDRGGARFRLTQNPQR